MNRSCSIVLLCIGVSGAGWADIPPPTPPDAVQINYASNLNAGDSVVNLTNGGMNGAFLEIGGPNGNVCANIYGFNPQQAMISCCACQVSPDSLHSLSVRGDILSNTLTAGVPTSIIVKLIATTPVNGTCRPGSSAHVNASSLVSGLRAWGTTLHQHPAGGYAVTENHFQNVTVGTVEFQQMVTFCGWVQLVGSGYGMCHSCQNIGLGGVRR